MAELQTAVKTQSQAGLGTFYSLDHSSSNKFKWQLCVIMSGGFGLESVAGIKWNEWLFLPEYASEAGAQVSAYGVETDISKSISFRQLSDLCIFSPKRATQNHSKRPVIII